MGKRISTISFSIAAVAALIFMMSGQSWAMIYSNDDLQLTGKVEAKAAFFTNEARGYTTPKFKAWDMFKQRNMAYLELTHDISKLTGMDMQYHIVARGLYEGVYDYGPGIYRDAYDNNKAAFDRYNLKGQVALWEAYANYKNGPINLRVGRQNLSWGNTDIIRVIDHINPLDNTWGGTGTESLDDRRIPLWMIRLGYQASTYFGLEGYLVPGAIDNTVGPITPMGSPYASAVPTMDGLRAYGIEPGFNNSWGAMTEPSRDMESSRVGLKLLLPGLLGGSNSNVELSYQRTYWDGNALRFASDNPAGWPGVLAIEFKAPKVNIFGVSGNYVFQDLDLIVKGDLAHVQGEPVFINEINQPGTLTQGEFTFRDFTNIGLSFERNFWIKAINRGEKVQFLLEYYGMYCHNWDDRMIIPIRNPDEGSPVDSPQKRYEQMVALSVTSEYHMKTKVNVAVIWNPAGSMAIIPTVTYRFNNPFTVAVGYSCNFGGFVIPFAQDQDRDQVNVMVKYEF